MAITRRHPPARAQAVPARSRHHLPNPNPNPHPNPHPNPNPIPITTPNPNPNPNSNPNPNPNLNPTPTLTLTGSLIGWRSTSALANLPLSWRDLAAETTLREPTFAHVALCYRETAEERAARGKPPMPGHLHLALYHDVPRCDPNPSPNPIPITTLNPNPKIPTPTLTPTLIQPQP